MKYPNIYVGDIIGDFKVIEFLYKDENGHNHLKVKCEKCGREKSIKDCILKRHIGIYHSSCGKGLKTLDKKFYSHWQNMRTRTDNPNYEHYDRYGGRGIKSEEFRCFIDFYDAMYKSYKEHIAIYTENNTTLERMNYDKDYSITNCKWATWEEQHENTSRNKSFRAISPSGIEYTSRNQCAFAREHHLEPKQISACLNGRFKSHLGWKFEFI